MDNTIESAVRAEVEALHAFFVGWFSGVLSEHAFEPDFLARFDADFLLIPPAGGLVSRAALADAVRGAYASNPEFRIVIRNVCVRRTFGDTLLATYEEWQVNALASKPSNNARLASVLFKSTARLSWLHIHETWMPQAQTGAERFDF